jgi:hypothetical protein
MHAKFAVIGFPKCGTKSLVDYLKVKYFGCETIRPETVYKDFNPKHEWKKKGYQCVAIIRNPIERIHSGHQYFPHLRNLSVKDLLAGNWPHSERDQGVGFADCIEQSDYQKYINKFESEYDVKVNVYQLEDLVTDSEFPQINKSTYNVKWSDEDLQYVKDKLKSAGFDV